MRFSVAFLALAALLFGTPVSAQEASEYRGDAEAIVSEINANYAYLDRLPEGRFAPTEKLRGEAANVSDKRTLLKYAERVLMLLADHHVITGSSFADSWAVVPSYSDLWIERSGGAFRITSVRRGSPAALAGITADATLTAIGDTPIDKAVDGFWRDLGVTGPIDDRQASFAARILAAGRRNGPRSLGVANPRVPVRTLTLASLYGAATTADGPPITVSDADGVVTIRFNNSLGDQATIAAFDTAMANMPANARVRIDLRDTPSGGNTSVARGILGWFVTRPTAYQVHNLPAELRETGIERQWIEQVLPRKDKHWRSSVSILVGRWTGSMGEGLAVAFDAIGMQVYGEHMAGLLGAVYDMTLPNSGLLFKLPVERLSAPNGKPREDFVPRPMAELPD